MGRLVLDATGNDLTYRIIGAAMSVRNSLGPGYKEEVYERALAPELRERHIAAESQFRVAFVVGRVASPLQSRPLEVNDTPIVGQISTPDHFSAFCWP